MNKSSIVKMIAIDMDNYEIIKSNIYSKKFTVNCIYIIICLFTFIINYNYTRRNKKRFQEEETVASSNEAEEETVASSNEVAEETVASSNEVAEETVASSSEVAVASSNEVEEKRDINTWYTIEDGKCRYKGEWKNGLPNGKGIKHFYKNDSYVEGNFVDSFAEGYGKQIFEQTWEKSVPYYEGEFKRNGWNGKGEYHYGDGDYYKGMWKDSKYHGQGAAYSQRLNRTWVGEYKNDEKVEGNWVKGEI
jgi:hypothetical protein